MSKAHPTPAKTCFFIAPIGDGDSPIRKRSDEVLRYIVIPAAEAHDLEALRADAIGKPGRITLNVIEYVLNSPAAVVDLTGANPNVYYEMALRHAARKPTALIAEQSEALPFDIHDMNTIFFDHTNLASANECMQEVTTHLREAFDGAVESPVTTAATVNSLTAGSTQEQTLASLVTSIDRLSGDTNRFLAYMELKQKARRGIAINPKAIIETCDAFNELTQIARTLDNGELTETIQDIWPTINYMRRLAQREGHPDEPSLLVDDNNQP